MEIEVVEQLDNRENILLDKLNKIDPYDYEKLASWLLEYTQLETEMGDLPFRQVPYCLFLNFNHDSLANILKKI